MSDKKKSFWYWTKTVGLGIATTAVTFAPEIMQVFPEHTLVFKLALPAGFFIKWLMTKGDYQKDQLPSGMTRLLDRIPNKYTGIKGSQKLP